METSMDLTQGLPHDLLADVLGRLHPSPRSLAASRCVSKAWCIVVDAHRLLTDLLPHAPAGPAGMLVHARRPVNNSSKALVAHAARQPKSRAALD
jgi:hypothetical protein